MRLRGCQRVTSPAMNLERMSARRREELIHELEVEHRVAVVDAAKLKREIRGLTAALEAKEQRIREIEDGIAVLRDSSL
ncbi:hypothetical protein SEA_BENGIVUITTON_33 [Mycobacterium phage BengiVuitton]|nr:hypothetical protein SEA_BENGIVUITTON_33 [Mycobacterium phage BengiVuitton]